MKYYYWKYPSGVYSRLRSRTKYDPRLVGTPICTKQQFMDWCLRDELYLVRWDLWEASGFDNKLRPVIARKDDSRGFWPNNMIWDSSSNAKALGAVKRKRTNQSGFKGVYCQGNRFRARIWLEGKFVDLSTELFESAQDAARCWDRRARSLGRPEHTLNFPKE